MGNGSLKILLVAEGSGGHLIPALQVAQSLSRQGASIKLWYAQRRQTAPLAGLLAQEASDARVDIDPIPLESSAGWFARLAGSLSASVSQAAVRRCGYHTFTRAPRAARLVATWSAGSRCPPLPSATKSALKLEAFCMSARTEN